MTDAALSLESSPPVLRVVRDEHLHPKGVGVVVEAEHLCMSLRGVQAAGSTTVTSALHGLLRTDARSRAEFFALTGVNS